MKAPRKTKKNNLKNVTTEPSNEGNLSLGFIQLRTHQHLQRNTTNAWYETSNHLTSTCDTNDQAKQCNSTRHVIKQCNSARHVIRLISGGIETKPSQRILNVKMSTGGGPTFTLSLPGGKSPFAPCQLSHWPKCVFGYRFKLKKLSWLRWN